MSIKHNILANYASQIYVALIGIVMVPMYVRYIGVEGYGLVGFFVTLQAWFQVLDMGLTPTMAREAARFTGGATDALDMRRLLRAMEGVFVGVALLGGSAMLAGSGFIASSWLKVQELPIMEVQYAIMLMAVIVALRWVGGLYRGVLTGFERLVWLNGFNIVMATARFVLVIPFFIYVGAGPIEFFGYQLVLAVIELVVLVAQAYRRLPGSDRSGDTAWPWRQLRGVLKFSLGIAAASMVWILATQADKLLLSNLLSLTDYGYFSVAVLMAGGVLVVSGPVSSAILPRMARLEAMGDERGLIQIYRSATQLVAVIAVPVALILAFFAEQVLWAWTGNQVLVEKAMTILALYAVGSGLLVLAAFPYYLQNAKGDLKLHLLGNLLFVVLLVPSLTWATWEHGMIGAGWVWLVLNLVYFLLWVPVVHYRFARGLHGLWLMQDVIFPTLPAALCAWLLYGVMSWPFGRTGTFVQLCLMGGVLSACAVLGSNRIRSALFRRAGAF